MFGLLVNNWFGSVSEVGKWCRTNRWWMLVSAYKNFLRCEAGVSIGFPLRRCIFYVLELWYYLYSFCSVFSFLGRPNVYLKMNLCFGLSGEIVSRCNRQICRQHTWWFHDTFMFLSTGRSISENCSMFWFVRTGEESCHVQFAFLISKTQHSMHLLGLFPHGRIHKCKIKEIESKCNVTPGTN